MPTLSMTAFKGAVAKGPLAPVYVFHGADDHLKDLWVRRVIEAATDAGTRDFNLEVLRGGECDAGRLAGALDALPMLAERRVVVLRDPGALKKAVQPRLLAYLKQPATETVLLLVVPAGDAPAAPWTAAASVVEFRALEGEDLVKWIVHQTTTACGGTILPEAAALLAAYGGSDLSLLDGELKKLVAYTAGAPIDAAAVEAVTGVRPGHTVGDFLDAVARRDTATALALVEDALAQPKSSGVTLVMALATQTLAIGWGLAARARTLGVATRERVLHAPQGIGRGVHGTILGRCREVLGAPPRQVVPSRRRSCARAAAAGRPCDERHQGLERGAAPAVARAGTRRGPESHAGRGMTVRALRSVRTVLSLLTLVCSASLAAQSASTPALDSAIARARRLVNEGAGAVGRSVVDSVLARVTPGSPDEATILYWRATLAESWEAAQQDYLRLMLEFDGSALAGEAMLRLAQG